MSELLDNLFGNKEEKEEKTALEELFETKEQTFSEVMEDMNPSEEEDANLAVKGDPKPISKDFEQKSRGFKFINITNGWNREDFVMHIAPASHKKTWKLPLEANYNDNSVIKTIILIMNKHIPKNHQVDIHLPVSDWEIKELTFKAIKLKSVWSVTEEDLEKMILELFEELNKIV